MKRAASMGDKHECTISSGAVSKGANNILIGGQPAARMGDPVSCLGPDFITSGSLSVMFGGQPAARIGDKTTFSGAVSTGFPTVLIGDVRPPPPPDDEEQPEPKPTLVNVAFELLDDRMGKPMKNLSYRLDLPDGSFRQGTTDGSGWLREQQVPEGSYVIWLQGERYEVWWRGTETDTSRAENVSDDSLQGGRSGGG